MGKNQHVVPQDNRQAVRMIELLPFILLSKQQSKWQGGTCE